MSRSCGDSKRSRVVGVGNYVVFVVVVDDDAFLVIVNGDFCGEVVVLED